MEGNGIEEMSQQQQESQMPKLLKLYLDKSNLSLCKMPNAGHKIVPGSDYRSATSTSNSIQTKHFLIMAAFMQAISNYENLRPDASESVMIPYNIREKILSENQEVEANFPIFSFEKLSKMVTSMLTHTEMIPNELTFDMRVEKVRPSGDSSVVIERFMNLDAVNVQDKSTYMGTLNTILQYDDYINKLANFKDVKEFKDFLVAHWKNLEALRKKIAPKGWQYLQSIAKEISERFEKIFSVEGINVNTTTPQKTTNGKSAKKAATASVAPVVVSASAEESQAPLKPQKTTKTPKSNDQQQPPQPISKKGIKRNQDSMDEDSNTQSQETPTRISEFLNNKAGESSTQKSSKEKKKTKPTMVFDEED